MALVVTSLAFPMVCIIWLLLQDPERHKECEALLGALSNEKFTEIVRIGKAITDFVPESERQDTVETDELDEEYGVAVEFEDEDEQEDHEELNEVQGTVDFCTLNSSASYGHG